MRWVAGEILNSLKMSEVHLRLLPMVRIVANLEEEEY